MAGSSYKQTGRLLLRLLLIAVVLLICDRGIGKVLKHLYFKQDSGVGYRTTYAIDSTSADILIFGSSRANHCYVPDIIEDSLHKTCYNAGRDGNYILYNYAVFKSVTKRYTPKAIFFDIRPEDFTYSTAEYERLSLLLPYYRAHPEIRHIIDFRGPFEKLKTISAIYPYNSLILQILMGNLNKNKERAPDIKGYVPNFNLMKDEKMDTLKITDCSFDETKYRAVKDIISTCRQKGIDLVFVYSPVWNAIKSGYCDRVSELCSESGTKYLNLSNTPVFTGNHDYFSDWDHVNDKGARIFSAMLAEKFLRTR
jgi:hypothetical protein